MELSIWATPRYKNRVECSPRNSPVMQHQSFIIFHPTVPGDFLKMMEDSKHILLSGECVHVYNLIICNFHVFEKIGLRSIHQSDLAARHCSWFVAPSWWDPWLVPALAQWAQVFTANRVEDPARWFTSNNAILKALEFKTCNEVERVLLLITNKTRLLRPFSSSCAFAGHPHVDFRASALYLRPFLGVITDAETSNEFELCSQSTSCDPMLNLPLMLHQLDVLQGDLGPWKKGGTKVPKPTKSRRFLKMVKGSHQSRASASLGVESGKPSVAPAALLPWDSMG